MASERPDSILWQGGRLRPGWRISLFFLLFFLLTLAGHVLVAPLPAHPLGWSSLGVTMLAVLAASGILLRYVDGRPLGALGFHLDRTALRETGGGVLVGALLIGAAVVLLLASRSAALVPDEGDAGGYLYVLAWTLAFFGIAAALEEALFRGYPFQVMVEWIGAWPAILVASGVFAYLHAQNPHVTRLALLNIFLAGVLLSIAYLRTRSLWFATGVHLGWNWAMATLFDFPVSGLTFETPLYSGVPHGVEWWTGGDFGPEAGVVGTLVLAAGTAWMLRSRRLRPAAEIQRLDPIVNRRLGTGDL